MTRIRRAHVGLMLQPRQDGLDPSVSIGGLASIAGRVAASDHPKADSVGGQDGRQSSCMMSPDRLRLAMELLGGITQGELSRASGVSTTTISLFLAGKRDLRPAMEVKLIEGLERAFMQNGARLDTAFFDPGRCRAPKANENRPPSG